MTTLRPIQKACAICGTVSEHMSIGSTSAFGSPDLDTRPPAPARNSIAYWIQRCPSCGYCAPDIAESTPEAAEVVKHEGYQGQLRYNLYPDLANSFLCYSLIQDYVGDLAGAGWSALHAAWVCDDAGEMNPARHCRQWAVLRFLEAREKGQTFAQDSAAEDALLADLYRRQGNFDKAQGFCERGESESPNEAMAAVLRFEKALCAKWDRDRHTVAEAMNWRA